jgi:ABC-type transport system substrate-binding protein
VIAIIPMIPMSYAQNGPKIDVLRHLVIQSPDAQLIEMRAGRVDISEGQIRTNDIETLDSDGHLITQDLGFHMGFIGWNIRDLATIQSYYRPTVTYWPLYDVAFRHALIHAYDQLGIIPPIYGYVVTPVRSLVPPAQSKYYNPAVMEHPYNPGNPFTSPSGEHSTVGILKAAGYTFVDNAPTGVVNDADYWKMPNAQPLDQYKIWTPLTTVAPTSFQHGAEYVADLAAIGLASTSANGNHGIINEGKDFNEYLNIVYGTGTQQGGKFDGYMVFYSLGRIPDQLYSLLHSSQDTKVYPGRRNAVGMNNPTIDTLCDTVKFSLNPNTIETAAKSVQSLLYDPANSYALAYMTLYSRSYFNAYTKNLQGVVKSPGYGSDNSWTYLAMNYKTGYARTEGTKTVAIYVNGDYPDSFNPTFATTVYEWNIIGQTQDGLTAVNPYNHNDIDWVATDWTITETTLTGGMNVAYTIRSDVKWQDGVTLNASHIEWDLEFIRDRHVPRYAETWQTLTNVVVTDATHFTIQCSKPGLGLFYDYNGLAIMLPKWIWDRPWASDAAVLDYNPNTAYSPAPGYAAGPTPTPKNLFGTGPWVFRFYDSTNGYDDMWKNDQYFMSQAAVATLMTQMFWEVGDYNQDGIVNVVDLTFVSFAYGYMIGDPGYDVNADFNSDGIVDMRDLRTSAFHLLWQKTLKAPLP